MADKLTPLKAIRAYCLGCMCDQPNEVKLCPVTKCELYPYRFGKNPFMQKEMTDEQRETLRERGRKNISNLAQYRNKGKDAPPSSEEPTA